MHPFNVLVREVEDPDLGPLLTKLAEAGFSNPVVTQTGGADEVEAETQSGARAAAKHEGDMRGDLPAKWDAVRELPEQVYRWPEYEERYLRYVVYAGETATEGMVHIALGKAPREEAWGRKRNYIVGFLTNGGPQTPLVEFLETDDYEQSREFLAVVRGNGGSRGRKMYGPGDSLPEIYVEKFRTEVYSDRIQYPGSWNKIAVIAHGDDYATMLNHALVQARRRGDV